MKAFTLRALLVVSVVALVAAWAVEGRVTAQAQAKPALADYFTLIAPKQLDRAYQPRKKNLYEVTEDLDGDGNQDLVELGEDYPTNGGTTGAPQPARVFLGDGDGHFTPAPTDLFPVDSLQTIQARKTLFADFNADGRPDMFLACWGWDGPPFPGEQNRLYLSLPTGGWRDATDSLPQIVDNSHTAAVGDISGRGLIDIYVGNYAGPNKVKPYTLLNNGSGLFRLTTTNIPVESKQFLDSQTGHASPGATLTDLNGDGLPELIVTADAHIASYNKLLRTTILWNRAGTFVESDITELPLPGTFSTSHIDLDVQRIDVNQDGLPDLVLVGTQGDPLYEGWFVQILINKGDRQFVDETADRLQPGDISETVGTAPNNAPWPIWVRVLDFNHDGAPDFSVEFNGYLGPAQPIIWINDGTGHFSTLKVRDFVTAGNERTLGTAHLMPTRNGYSFITTLYLVGQQPMIVTGLLATKPYR